MGVLQLSVLCTWAVVNSSPRYVWMLISLSPAGGSGCSQRRRIWSYAEDLYGGGCKAMAHIDNIAEVVTGRFANTGDVGGHQGYTHRRKLGSLMQTARQRRQAGSSKQICKKCAHWRGACEQERLKKKQKSKRHQHSDH